MVYRETIFYEFISGLFKVNAGKGSIKSTELVDTFNRILTDTSLC